MATKKEKPTPKIEKPKYSTNLVTPSTRDIHISLAIIHHRRMGIRGR